ncbi:hypothetical protein CDD81_7833 [Ophiocordyceps australis]|uniref:Glycylpeptide N-tetradecanoyltransferase n=1 Tax=Ophiocordyceps australis TaxID=1399860 RepID=A0A2C5YFI1_9HYPO|nr:hypothetical protein CDD81_7833 [Ophiocordyceps australis]
MPSEESKPVEPVVDQVNAQLNEEQEAPTDSSDDDEAKREQKKKHRKKKSKRAKAKEILTGKKSHAEEARQSESPDDEASLKRALEGLTPQQLKDLLALNPSLAQEVSQSGGEGSQAAETLGQMKLQDIMTGLATSGKNAKDMGAYKFWQTQPVPRFDEDTRQKVSEGPLREQKVEDVSTEAQPLVEGFEWVTMDLENDAEMKEVYELLNGHYVEDDEAMFRFNYSPSILRWAMMAPGWQRRYHIGVRATQSRKLVAFISAIPVRLRIRSRTVTCSEVNFLCIHKKLRGKRLAPVLIKEITRISNLDATWQGLYTAGVVLPRPVSTCRYYHRSINWQKLHECGFSPLPAGSKPQFQIRKYALPDRTATKGLREMKAADVDAVRDLLTQYLARFDMAPEFTHQEALHWFIPKSSADQVIWSYVVEENGKITDFFSFFCVESSVINNSKHDVIRVAYLFYYASQVGLTQPVDKSALKTRLNALINDALILAKRHRFDVFNALTLMDNALFLNQQKFGGGDGQLHYYLFNYMANPIAGGIDKRNQLDEENCSGIGLVMP